MKLSGFTLIELVLVILVISILAVTAAPKLFTETEFETVSHRDQTIAILRTAQQRAMQDTQSSNSCHRVRFLTSSLGLSAQLVSGACDTGVVSATGADDFLFIQDLNSYSATNAASSTISYIDFDDWGRPTPSTGSCVGSGCTVDFGTAQLCIESEGYIHACP